jgi:hypothetical protein
MPSVADPLERPHRRTMCWPAVHSRDGGPLHQSMGKTGWLGAIVLESQKRSVPMANREQRGNREKRKPKKEKPKPAPQTSSFSTPMNKGATGKKTG